MIFFSEQNAPFSFNTVFYVFSLQTPAAKTLIFVLFYSRCMHSSLPSPSAKYMKFNPTFFSSPACLVVVASVDENRWICGWLLQNLGSRRLALAGNIKLMPATKSFVTQIPLAASSARRRSSNYARFSIFTERKLMLFCNPYIVLSWGFRLSVKVNDVVGNEAILLPRKIMKLLFFRSRSPTSTTILLLEKKTIAAIFGILIFPLDSNKRPLFPLSSP